MRSPRSEPCVRGLDGSMAMTARLAAFAKRNGASRATRVLLPAPGGPVMPISRERPENSAAALASVSATLAFAALLRAWLSARRSKGECLLDNASSTVGPQQDIVMLPELGRRVVTILYAGKLDRVADHADHATRSWMC